MSFKPIINPFTKKLDLVREASTPGEYSDLPCSTSVQVGDVLSTSGGTYLPALSNSINNGRWVGVCVSKLSATQCTVRTGGPTGAIYSGSLVADTEYYVDYDVPGRLSSSKSSATGAFNTNVGRALSTSELFIRNLYGSVI